MEPHSHPSPNDPRPVVFPTLPIVTPDPPERLSQREKYGGLFYFGIAGLVALVALISWFGYGVWSLRDVWSQIYVLHDSKRPDAERIQAAYALSRDPRVTQDELWEISLRKPLPALARYVLAEALTPELPGKSPADYLSAVAKSPGWPAWLRVVLARPLAYAAADGISFAREPLEVLKSQDDPTLKLLASFVMAKGLHAEPSDAKALEQACETPGPNQEFACLLRQAFQAGGRKVDETKALDQATLWLRTHHPAIAPLWKGWKIDGQRLVPSER